MSGYAIFGAVAWLAAVAIFVVAAIAYADGWPDE